ncbi:phosphopantetheine-binding protein, partial [Pseudomonas sp. NPDC089752]|uniref:phosphopantetheine-binding protein n=1 Tax=Pseudomonas sp. NPDC089752 TaxID=3364472 RepID=UPI00382AEBA7
GDLARQRADGVIEYMGRIDHQVKIRGLRIELGEIEARLLEQDQVREAAVVAQTTASGAQLVAYVVPTEPAEALLDRLKLALQATLPDYMVPAHFVVLEALPLSANGKLERRALPAPQASAGVTYRAPQSELECLLATTWQELLKVERVGLDDDFFELGGHSLQLIMLQARLRSALGIELTINDFYALRTLWQLAERVQAITADNDPGDELDLIFGALDELEEHNA